MFSKQPQKIQALPEVSKGVENILAPALGKIRQYI